MKRKAIISKSDADWSTFKSLRNRVNSTVPYETTKKSFVEI
jgi:hypothetical protein